MKYKIIIWIFLLSSCFVFGQNKSNRKGLKYGLWANNSGNTIDSTNYKIIRIKKLDTVKQTYYSPYYFNVARNNDTFDINFNPPWGGGRSKKHVSVDHGISKLYDLYDKSINISYYYLGQRLWRKDYDSLGEIKTYYKSTGYLNDSSYVLYFKDKRVIKRYFDRKEDYYPFDNLIISTDKLKFDIDFKKTNSYSQQFNITSKVDLNILSIAQFTNRLNITDTNDLKLNFPIYLKSGELITIKVSSTQKPDSDTIISEEKIIIHTDKGDYKDYEINCYTDAYHFGALDYKTSPSIVLSKSKDKYLWLQKHMLGRRFTQIWLIIDNEKTWHRGYQLNLNTLENGNYQYFIFYGHNYDGDYYNFKIVD